MKQAEPLTAALAAPRGEPLIELRGVTRVYGSGELATQVLHGIDLQIYPGEFVAIVGASGSGKSTLMNILGCLDRPSAGQYLFRGHDVSDFGRDQLAALRREAFGFVFQSYHLIAGSSALENVEVPAIYAGTAPAQRHARAAELLHTLGLGERLGYRPNQLSGGQQQRVSIARALMNGGHIILADEPTGALDSKSGRDVMALLKDLSARGHTVILITHAREVAEHAQRIIEVRDGRILSDPGPQRLRIDPASEVVSVPAPEPAAPRVPPLPGPEHRSLLGEAGEAARMAVRALRGNLFRAILTLLGIVIGVASVIAMLAVGEGSKRDVVDRIAAQGTNLLLIRPGAPNQRGVGGSVATLVPADAEAVAELDNVAAAVPEMQGAVTLRYGNADYQSTVVATSELYPLARNWEIASGSFFSRDEVRGYAAVVVLGRTVVDKLFPDGSDPIGRYVALNNALFQVVGVLAVKGASPFGSDQDDTAIVPLTTGSLRLFGQPKLRSVTVSVADETRMDETQDAVQQLMLARHGVEDFQIRNMASLLQTVSETQNTLTVLLGSIAAISLLVGGIGVMNIMLVSVTERTREIGIRMATGARVRNILQQFLIEALVVSALGGVVGVALGLSIAYALSAFGTSVHFSAGPVLLAFGCAFGTGLVFGWLPARKAAGLDPVVALAAE